MGRSTGFREKGIVLFRCFDEKRRVRCSAGERYYSSPAVQCVAAAARAAGGACRTDSVSGLPVLREPG